MNTGQQHHGGRDRAVQCGRLDQNRSTAEVREESTQLCAKQCPAWLGTDSRRKVKKANLKMGVNLIGNRQPY